MTRSRLQHLLSWPVRLAGRVHRDERGSISILTVFAIFMFTILMVKVINVGRHLDDKLRMQNSADASAYSGGVVMARGMNTLAFTNHLEAEVFALTAYMRTAAMLDESTGQPAVESLTPQILQKWEEIGKIFEEYGGKAEYEKFRKLGRAIQQKKPLEENVVRTFSEMSARHAELTLPVLEYILHAGDSAGGGFGGTVNEPPEGGIIPRFQRTLIRTTPLMANLAANETARRYGTAAEKMRTRQTELASRLWRTDVTCFCDGNEDDPLSRTVPAIDPSPTGPDGPPDRSYFEIARKQRKSLATHYLELWIRDWMGPYFSYARRNRPGRETAKMSQFINLWRTFACGQLRYLLEVEYPETNLPHVIRKPSPGLTANRSLELDTQFVAVTYWTHIHEMYPGLLKNSFARKPGFDPQTFAQATIFIPRRRYLCCPWAWPYWVTVTLPDGTQYREIRWRLNIESWPQGWDLLNQNWTTKLVPATTMNLGSILEQSPPGINGFRPPRFSGVSPGDIRKINKH
ncbi:MAG: Tad domain-containing protein [Planctomycetes bacterium]|nr:Tad domain-containing protein [Planctomycetota bacterium]